MATTLTATGVTFSDAVEQKRAYTGPTVVYYYSSTTWTCPPGITKILVCVIGGGGGGGGGYGSGTYEDPEMPGGFGGVGGIAAWRFTTIPGTTYTITIGAGGAGSNTGNGSAGGTSSFDIITATGGGGGVATINSTSLGTNGANGSSSYVEPMLPIAPTFSRGYRARATGSTAAVVANDSSYFAGSGGSGELGMNSNATGGVGGAVMIYY